MELFNSADDEKFLYVFGSPFKSFCKCLSLRSGVLALAIIDLVIGTFNSLLGVWVLLSFVFAGGYRKPMAYLLLLSAGINVLGIPMAIIGISGITKLSERNLLLYYKFELFEMFAEGFLNIIEAEISDMHIYRGHVHFHNIFLNVLFTGFIIMLSGLTTKVVWSAYIRIRYEETLLVVHGEGVFTEMNANASNLVNPKVISPQGQVYYSKELQ
jgi:hypothetical protein